MEDFYRHLMARAATFDELLGDDFEALPGQKSDSDLAARRLAAWCRSSASGDWSLFERRLARDGETLGGVLAKFATVRCKASPPAWVDDAIWIEQAMRSPARAVDWSGVAGAAAPCAFEHLFLPVVEQAERRLWASTAASARDNLDAPARGCLCLSLLGELSGLAAPALYERFAKAREARGLQPKQDGATTYYDQFIADLKAGELRRLFEDKPVLLRLVATVTRQWIAATREFLERLDADLPAIRRDLLGNAGGRVASIEGGISDPHNHGRCVQIVGFADGARVMYKPKDLRLDVAWHALVERLNGAGAPVALRAVRALARDGYGWTEFVEHAGSPDADACRRYFRRAGAWLALFHGFAGTDMHQENMIAVGEHPVPIDLEMMLQATAAERGSPDSETQAVDAAMETIANSVLTVGLLPAYAKAPDNKVFAVGGVTSDWTSRSKLVWNDVNTDAMRPAKIKEGGDAIPNLPHVGGRYAKFGDHIEDFVSGFEDYATLLERLGQDADCSGLFDGFAGLPVRKVIRPTRFYYMLLQRLRNHRTMDDGVVWSVQADFLARLADWENESDPAWPLQHAERAALLALNVPHFVVPSDGIRIGDATGISVDVEALSGLDRARERLRSLDDRDIAWQVDVIRGSTVRVSRSDEPAAAGAAPKESLPRETPRAATKETLLAEADAVAHELSRRAIRRGPGAAWIGLDWLGGSEVFQLVALGPHLYDGLSGIALFLAAHAAVANRRPSAELALAALCGLRKALKSRNRARFARALGLGGALGLGSIVYALTVVSELLRDDALLADAHAAAELITADLIAADTQLDIMGGSAGAILALLRLHRRSPSADGLARATRCGEHLLAQPRVGAQGRRTWNVPGGGSHPLNGMSHGAAGFAYALAALAAASGREKFAAAAAECIAFENSSYDAAHANWPDLRFAPELVWVCKWCHGAPGIGLARAASRKRGGLDSGTLTTDIGNALGAVEAGWPARVDTLCCGTLGSIEFLREAAVALGRSELRELAARRLTAVIESAAARGDYRWNNGGRRFNLGFHLGLAGLGYTVLREIDDTLPNVLIWD